MRTLEDEYLTNTVCPHFKLAVKELLASFSEKNECESEKPACSCTERSKADYWWRSWEAASTKWDRLNFSISAQQLPPSPFNHLHHANNMIPHSTLWQNLLRPSSVVHLRRNDNNNQSLSIKIIVLDVARQTLSTGSSITSTVDRNVH